MRKVIHYQGKELSMYEKAALCLTKMMWHYTYCSYLFWNDEKNHKRLTDDMKKVTCKRCLRKLKQHGINI